MEDKKPEGPEYSWELLFSPGISWIVWEEDGDMVFRLLYSKSGQDPEQELKHLESVFPPDVSFLLHEIIRNASELNPGESQNIRVSHPGSSHGWAGIFSMLADMRGLIIWAGPGICDPDEDFCILHDHIRTERAICKANEKLNYFNSIVRHDIINLVMGIVGYLDIIDELTTDEEVVPLIKKSRNLGERVRRIAELTRSYQDLGIRSPEFINAKQVIRKILHRHEFRGNIQTTIHLPDLEVYVDRLFDEVIFEIVQNSLQFGGNGVSMEFSCATGSDGLTLIIADSGPGVQPDAKERIFSRNYADRNGYGLYLASEILDITEISIKETGTFGTGARFELHFPPGGFRILS